MEKTVVPIRVPWVLRRIPLGESHPLRQMYFAYVLKSEKDGRYYYGSTNNLERRLAAHNAGKVRSTKGRRPLKLIYFERFTTRSAAFQREQFFKSIEGRLWLKEQGII